MTVQFVATKFLTSPLRKMVAEINDFLPDDKDSRLSHQALKTWMDGLHRPRFLTILFLSEHATGWVKEFAVDMLAALKEDRNARK